ncbi:hypothetical protein [Sphingobacterium rhinopitheci]|uniref:hypothetical protein n=1 Tax=Sphingobacterium rhinopitheci TaxID=2781960 RepID=UPI001F516588|nr:hypothetical protein [Sphingobacterium rhinopitheci]MCI0921466.1 hypothetical protein [Sphingobacterium rhinopitheci]
MKTKINNLDELKWEIARLTELKREQESYLNDQYTLLKNKVDMPARVFGTVASSIPGFNLVKSVVSSIGKSSPKDEHGVASGDWLTKGIRIGLPILLNSTFLKKSGWMKKALVLLASQTATSQITQDSVSNLLAKVTRFIRPKKSKTKSNKVEKKLQENIEDSPEEQILGI